MKRKWLNGMMAVMFLIIQFSTLITSRQVNAEPIHPTTIIDQAELKVKVAGTLVGDQIIWQVAYQRLTSEQPRALKLRVSTDEAGEERLAPEPNELVQPMQAADTLAAHQWLIEKDYTTQAIGELTFKTPATQATLQVAAQLNEIMPAAAAATTAEAATTEPQIKADLLDAQIAGPHAVTVSVPEPEVKPEAEVSAPSASDVATQPEADATKPSATETSTEEAKLEAEEPEAETKPVARTTKKLTLSSGQTQGFNSAVDQDELFYEYNPTKKQMMVRLSLAVATYERRLTLPEGWHLAGGSDDTKVARDDQTLKLTLAGVRSSNTRLAVEFTKQASKAGGDETFSTDIDDDLTLAATLKTKLDMSNAKVLTPPSSDNPLAANNLVLTLGARADLQLGVDGLGNGDYNMYTKEHGKTTFSKYSTSDAMRKQISTDYQAGSSAKAVIMNSQTIARRATISLDYSHVGYVQTDDGDVQIGAYVTIKNIAPGGNDWTTTGANLVGIDFSTNFYSGISLANIREFDWEVTFYHLDGNTKRAVNFLPGSDDQQAMLTFTSLNPGEFVKPNDGNQSVILSDNTGVALKYLSARNLVPSDAGKFATYNWPTSGNIQAYTAQRWGNWTQGAVIDPNKEWADWLGAPTFGDGAASFALIGTTFSYRRGSYSAGDQTWLANASGTANFRIPPIANNKSITTNPNEGGGSVNQKSGDVYTDNALHTTNIDQIAENGQTMFYYINQETYTVIEDVVSRPNRIVIEDTLPEGMKLATNRYSDVKVLNETITDRTAPQTLTDFGNNGFSSNGSRIEITTVNNRTKIKVTLEANDIMLIPFKAGYFSVRLNVKSDYKPSTIDDEKKMINSATVKMYDSTNKEQYAETTNEVYVTVKPDRPEFDVSFTKVDDDKKPLAGAKFGLFAGKNDATPIFQSNVTLADGKVTFTKVQPGTYWLKEIQTPTGYQPASPIKVTIDDAGQLSGLTNQQVVNKLKLYDLELIKKGEDDQRLAGAKFVVKAGNTVVATGISKADATLVFDKPLKPGAYTLAEVEAPAGYQALAGKFSFTLTMAGDLTGLAYSGTDLKPEQWAIKMSADKAKVIFEITNPAETHELPVTGGAGIGGYLMIALLMMGTAVAWGLRRKKEVQ